MSLALRRLTEERKTFRAQKPFGFYARPSEKPDGSSDMFRWECGIPGKAGTVWEGGIFPIVLKFSDNYPSVPPIVKFTPPIFHPNVFNDGEVCLSIIKEESNGGTWRAAVTVGQILLGVQELLDDINLSSPANGKACLLYKSNRAKYDQQARETAKRFSQASL